MGGTLPGSPLCKDVKAIYSPKPIRGYYLLCINFTYRQSESFLISPSTADRLVGRSGKRSVCCPPSSCIWLHLKFQVRARAFSQLDHAFFFVCVSATSSRQMKRTQTHLSNQSDVQGMLRTNHLVCPKYKQPFTQGL